MDLPNLTLFVQMVHFIIAYYVLRRYVFAPGLEVVLVEQSRMQKLLSAIQNGKNQKEETVLRQKIRLSFIRNALFNIMPNRIVTVFDLKDKSIESVKAEEMKFSQSDKNDVRDRIYSDLLGVKR